MFLNINAWPVVCNTFSMLYQEAQRKAKAGRQIAASKAGQAASKTGLTTSSSRSGQTKEDRGSGVGEGGGGGGGEEHKLLQPRPGHSSRSATKVQVRTNLN